MITVFPFRVIQISKFIASQVLKYMCVFVFVYYKKRTKIIHDEHRKEEDQACEGAENEIEQCQ